MQRLNITDKNFPIAVKKELQILGKDAENVTFLVNPTNYNVTIITGRITPETLQSQSQDNQKVLGFNPYVVWYEGYSSHDVEDVYYKQIKNGSYGPAFIREMRYCISRAAEIVHDNVDANLYEPYDQEKFIKKQQQLESSSTAKSDTASKPQASEERLTPQVKVDVSQAQAELIHCCASFFNRLIRSSKRSEILQQVIKNIFDHYDKTGYLGLKQNFKFEDGNNEIKMYFYRKDNYGTRDFHLYLSENKLDFLFYIHTPSYGWGEDYDPEVREKASFVITGKQLTPYSIPTGSDILKCLSQTVEFLTRDIEGRYLSSEQNKPVVEAESNKSNPITSSSYAAISATIPLPVLSETKSIDEQTFLSECNEKVRSSFEFLKDLNLSTIELQKLNLIAKNGSVIDKPVKLNGIIYPLSTVINFEGENPNASKEQRYFEPGDLEPAVTDDEIDEIINERSANPYQTRVMPLPNLAKHYLR